MVDGSSEGKTSLIGGTIKSVVIIGALSYLAAGWLSTASRDNETLSRLAMNVSRGIEDPLTTGSIAGRANATKLDPCVVTRR